MTSATERLRALLDERGVEWKDSEPYGSKAATRFKVNGVWLRYVDYGDYCWMDYHEDEPLTPEQAIAATLGAGTCKDVCSSVAEFTCSACGFNCDLTSWISLFDGDVGRHRHHHHGTPHYCPNCGRRCVG